MAHPDTRHYDGFDTRGPDRFDGLHPAIYAALAGCALWMVVAAWASFSGQGYASYALAIVTGFFVIAGGIPAIMWRVWRRNADADAVQNPPFAAWWRGEMETWQGRVEGWDAAVEVLLPLGIAAIGMTLIGLVFRLTPGS